MQSKIALDKDTREAIKRQLFVNKAAGMDWGNIGEFGGLGALGGGALSGLGSYLTSDEQDPKKKRNKTLADALYGAGIGGAIGGGYGAVRNMLPHTLGGPETVDDVKAKIRGELHRLGGDEGFWNNVSEGTGAAGSTLDNHRVLTTLGGGVVGSYVGSKDVLKQHASAVSADKYITPGTPEFAALNPQEQAINSAAHTLQESKGNPSRAALDTRNMGEDIARRVGAVTGKHVSTSDLIAAKGRINELGVGIPLNDPVARAITGIGSNGEPMISPVDMARLENLHELGTIGKYNPAGTVSSSKFINPIDVPFVPHRGVLGFGRSAVESLENRLTRGVAKGNPFAAGVARVGAHPVLAKGIPGAATSFFLPEIANFVSHLTRSEATAAAIEKYKQEMADAVARQAAQQH